MIPLEKTRLCVAHSFGSTSESFLSSSSSINDRLVGAAFSSQYVYAIEFIIKFLIASFFMLYGWNFGIEENFRFSE